jgi:prophage regulatory protein
MAATLREDLARHAGEAGTLVDTFMRLPAVKHATGLGRSSIYSLVAAIRFPGPVKINRGRAVAWLASEVSKWQRERVAERDHQHTGNEGRAA